jgi:uncharacterized membrane protein
MDLLFALLACVLAVVALSNAQRAKKRLEEVEDELSRLRYALDRLMRGGAEPKAEPVVAPEPPTPEPPQPALEPEPIVQPVIEPVAARVAEPAAPPPPEPGPPPPPVIKPPFDWESLIGVKLFSWIAGVALVLAAIYFLRYGIEHNWLGPKVRTAIGVLAGATLIFVCELRIARGYKTTANAMHGAGVAILYATFFAMYAVWHLAGAGIVFPLMILVTIVAVWLSIRRESVFIALLGLVGGFATPALLSTGENRPIPLFSYLLLLNIGLAWVAYRRRWTTLTAVSLVLTAIYQWYWTGTMLTRAQLPLAAAIFALFGVVAASSLWLGRGGDKKQSIFDRIGVAGAALPLLFGAFIAAVPAYGARYNVLFGFLLLIAAGLAAIAVARGIAWLHLLGGVTTLLVFAIWRGFSFTPEAWPLILAWLAAFFVLYLGVGIWYRTPAVYVAPALLFVFPTLLFAGTLAARPWLLFGVLFALLAAAAAYALRFDDGIVYYLAAFFAIASEAVWSARFLTEERLTSGLALYGIFALFFLGVPILARRFDRKLAPRGAITAIVLLSIAVLFFLAGGALANASLWGLALMLGILNAGAFIEARAALNPVFAAAAMILSWIVIAVWWGAATVTLALIPALIVVGMFSILVVAGSVWASNSTSAFEPGTYLALIGHFFLMFVASQAALALPPWPLFGVLAVLDLAIGVAAIWLKRPLLMSAAMAASQIVLLVWTTHTTTAEWQRVELIAVLAVTALAMAWHRIDRAFGGAVLWAAFLGQVVVTAISDHTQVYPLLVATIVLLLVAILTIAWLDERHVAAMLASLTPAFAVAMATNHQPVRELTFSAIVYALFLAYPLLLGKRAKASIHPYLGAVLASGLFFGFAYEALSDLGYKPFIGALPVAQAILLLVVLVRLLRNEQATMAGRALVAAAALAFITLAVPLQLEKQWITIAWALEGAALVWLFRRIPHRGLLLWAGGLLAVVFARLAFNPAVFAYHPRTFMPVLNWYLYSYAVCAASMFVAAYLWPRGETRVSVPQILNSAATVLLFFLTNIEIADAFSTGSALTFNFFSPSLAQNLSYTIGWGLFAVAMLIAGIALHQRTVRVAAIILLTVTTMKCFLLDTRHLEGLYRVASLVGLAISLVLVGVLLQKFVIRKAEATIA